MSQGACQPGAVPVTMLGRNLLRNAGFNYAALFGEHIHLLAPDPDSASSRLRALLGEAGIAVAAIRPRTLSMEDVFVHYVTRLERGEAMQ